MVENSLLSKNKMESVNILILSVVRRDGQITPFKADKISNSASKAVLEKYTLKHIRKLEEN